MKKQDTYITANFTTKDDTKFRSLSYPTDFPIPNVGDTVVMLDAIYKEELRGIVVSKLFIVRETYKELEILINY